MNNKRFFKKFLSLILSFVLLFTAAPFLSIITVFAESSSLGELVDSVYYKIVDNEAVVTKCSSSPDREIVIKDEYKGYPVTKILDKAFYNDTEVIDKRYTPYLVYYRVVPIIESITIPKTIKYIGSEAFLGCGKIKKVIIEDIQSWCNIDFKDFSSNPLYYGKYNYSKNSMFTQGEKCTSLFLLSDKGDEKIKDIIIDWDCETIKDFTFTGCQGLETVVIKDNIKEIGKSAFFNCLNITSIKMPNSVTNIGDNTFSNCKKLNNITLNNRLKSIGKGAFNSCEGFTRIEIPDSVTSIGGGAFGGCKNLNEVYINDFAKWCDIKFYGEYSNPLCHANNLYLKDKLVTNLVIPDGVTNIGNYAFCNYSKLKNVKIPDSVTNVGDYAFFNCTELKTIYIPDSVKNIGINTFSHYNYDETKFVVYTESVNSEAYKYAKEHGLICIVFNEDIGNINFLTENNVLRIYGTGKTPDFNLFSSTPWYDLKDSITTIIIDEYITEIGTYSFYGFSKLKKIVSSNSELKFGKRAINIEDKNIAIYSINDGALSDYCKQNSIEFIKPEKPELITVTDSKIEIKCLSGMQYSLDGKNWQDVGIFKNLSPAEKYKVYSRRKSFSPFYGEPLTVITTKRKITAPVSPEVESYTASSVTLKSGYEYSLDGINWQKTNIFENLSHDKIYTLYQRIEENDTDFHSDSSEALYFTLPNKPQIKKIGATSIEVKGINGYEYSLDKIDWQNNTIFNELINNMNYTVYQRISKNIFPNSYQIVSEGITVCINGKDKTVLDSPPTPEVLSITSNSVTLKQINGYEYKMDNGEWQSSNEFTRLAPNSTHKFYQRIAETETSYASESSEALNVTTLKKTVEQPPVPEVSKKTPNSVTLKQISGYEYKIDNGEWQSSNEFTGLAPNSTHKFYQRIAETETSYASESSEALSVTTLKNTVEQPPLPQVLSKTSNSVTLKSTVGFEYSINGTVWQKSNAFTGLKENTLYTFFQRVAETETSYASYFSDGLKVWTDYAYISGDLDGDEGITDSDVLYLLKHTFRPEKYPVNQPCDYDGDGMVTDADAVYLLKHIFRPDKYPLSK